MTLRMPVTTNFLKFCGDLQFLNLSNTYYEYDDIGHAVLKMAFDIQLMVIERPAVQCMLSIVFAGSPEFTKAAYFRLKILMQTAPWFITLHKRLTDSGHEFKISDTFTKCDFLNLIILQCKEVIHVIGKTTACALLDREATEYEDLLNYLNLSLKTIRMSNSLIRGNLMTI